MSTMDQHQFADPTSQIHGAAGQVFIWNEEKENMLTVSPVYLCVLSAVDEYVSVCVCVCLRVCHSGIVKLALMVSDIDPSDPGIYSVTKKQSWQIC